MIKACLPISLLICFSFSINAQKLYYDILLKRDTIGTLVAERTSYSEETHFNIYTKANVKFLLTFSLDNFFKASYRGSQLYYSFTKNLINDKEKERTETIWDKNGYLIQKEGKEYPRLESIINFSVACLYHHMPEKYKEIYSERFCQFLPLAKLKDNMYQLTLPDDKKNLYYYNKEGICEKVEVEQTLANLTILLRK